jgi:hypothetical protein
MPCIRDPLMCSRPGKREENLFTPLRSFPMCTTLHVRAVTSLLVKPLRSRPFRDGSVTRRLYAAAHQAAAGHRTARRRDTADRRPPPFAGHTTVVARCRPSRRIGWKGRARFDARYRRLCRRREGHMQYLRMMARGGTFRGFEIRSFLHCLCAYAQASGLAVRLSLGLLIAGVSLGRRWLAQHRYASRGCMPACACTCIRGIHKCNEKRAGPWGVRVGCGSCVQGRLSVLNYRHRSQTRSAHRTAPR